MNEYNFISIFFYISKPKPVVHLSVIIIFTLCDYSLVYKRTLVFCKTR